MSVLEATVSEKKDHRIFEKRPSLEFEERARQLSYEHDFDALQRPFALRLTYQEGKET